MIAVNPKKLVIKDTTGLVSYPHGISVSEKWKAGEFATSATFRITGLHERSAHDSNPLPGYTPMAWLVCPNGVQPTYTFMICTEGTNFGHIPENPQNFELYQSVERTGTNGNFGGAGQLAAPPELNDMVNPVMSDPNDIYTVVITRLDNDHLSVVISSDNPLYAGVTWELATTMEGRVGFFTGPIEMWFGAVSKEYRDNLAANGYTGNDIINTAPVGAVIVDVTLV